MDTNSGFGVEDGTLIYVNRYLSLENGNFIFPEGIDKIGTRAFSQCQLIWEVHIPESVTEIGPAAFNGCTSLKTVTLPSRLETISMGTFYKAESLTDIIIPPNVKIIEADAFSMCSRLKEIEIPPSVQTIDTGAFNGCYSLEKITIPNTLEKLGSGEYAGFRGLHKLKTLTYGDLTLENMNGIRSIKLTNGELVVWDTQDAKLIVMGQEEIKEMDLSIFDIEKIERIKDRAMGDVLINWKEACTSKKGVVDEAMLKSLEDAIMLNLEPTPENINLVKQGMKSYQEIKALTGYKEFEEQSDVFKMCYSLGLFSGDQAHASYIKSFIATKLENGSLDRVNIHQIFDTFKLDDGYNQQKAGLLISALNDPKFLSNPDFIARINNEYPAIKKYIKKEYKEIIGRDYAPRENRLEQEEARLEAEISALEAEIIEADKEAAIDRRTRLQKLTAHFKQKETPEEHPAIAAISKIESKLRTLKESLIILQREIHQKNESISKIGLEEVMYYIDNNAFLVREGNEFLKSVMADLRGINQEQFDQLQDLYESSIGTEKSIAQTIDTNKEGYTYQWSAGDNPTNLVLGHKVGCCAKIGGAGEDIMRQSMINPLVQNLIIRDHNQNIVGKATAYYNQEQGYILFNNVEAVGGVDKAQAMEALKRAAMDQVVAMEAVGQPLTEIRVGMLRNDVVEEQDLPVIKEDLLENYAFANYSGDANNSLYGQGVLYTARELHSGHGR